MASQTDIVNLALIRLGQKTVASLSEASVAARTASQLWDPVRRDALRAYPWNFANRFLRNMVELTGPTCSTVPPDNSTPDYQFSYQLPTDCLRVRQIYNPANRFLQMDIFDTDFFDTYPAALLYGLYDYLPARYEVRENQVLFTDVICAGVWYTYDVTDTTKFDDRFVTALSYRLAMDLAMPITGSLQKLQGMTQLYQSALMAARVVDAQESHRRVIAGQSFMRSRM